MASLPDAAPRLVYDAESVDGTTRVAIAHGADVVIRPWTGFARARIDAAAMVQTPWIFMLDADERLTPELRAELAALEPPHDVDGYSVARMNFFCGRWIRGAGWWPDRSVRLFRAGRATLASRNAASVYAVHERWTVSGRCIQLASPLEHQSYATLAAYRAKYAYYTGLEAEGLRGKVSLGSLLVTLGMTPVRALWLLVARRGILDGWRGVYVSARSAAYPLAVRWKARRG